MWQRYKRMPRALYSREDPFLLALSVALCSVRSSAVAARRPSRMSRRRAVRTRGPCSNGPRARARAAPASGVPLLIGNDSVHGHANLRGATLFPHHIGQGCMNDASLVEELRGCRRESHACGINWMFAPCCTVPDDLRWGRTYEAFSEDPAVVAELAAAEVRGIQTCGVPMAACVKHWVARDGSRHRHQGL